MITLPIRYNVPMSMTLTGATWEEVQPFYPNDAIRQIERASIRTFMEENRQYLKGRVLDFGAGKPGTCLQPQPYRDLVEGEYIACDKGDSVSGRFDAVMCNQVAQYLFDPFGTIEAFRNRMRGDGYLVMTYPTNWAEVEATDFWRFTKAGMEHMLKLASFTVLAHQLRAEVRIGNFSFPLGYGVVAQK